MTQHDKAALAEHVKDVEVRVREAVNQTQPQSANLPADFGAALRAQEAQDND